ncbi:MAG: ATP-binding protein [Treponema sp.]|nr:ATP-binding protein [Treponema sp.]
MINKSAAVLGIIFIIICVLPVHEPVYAQTGNEAELPVVKVAFSDDQSIISERVMHEALKRSGYQMLAKATGMRTAIADVNYGDAAILPVQTDGLDRMYPNLIKVPVVIDYVEFTVYTLTNRTYHFSGWEDMEGLRLGYRWQNEYVANNIWRARAGDVVIVNDHEEVWASLFNGDADAVILPRFSHYEHRFPQGIKRAGEIERQPVYSYVNNRFEYLIPALEKTYQDMLADGTMELIHSGERIINDKPFILHINSLNAQNVWERSKMETIHANIETKIPLEYYSIYLNSNEPHSQVSFNSVISEMIRTEFIARYPNLIISSGGEAFNFVTENYYLLFPNLPVLFYGVSASNSSKLYGLEEHITGVCETFSFRENASLMLKLFPRTKRIYILNDHYISRSIGIRETILNELHAYPGSFPAEVTFSEDKPLPELLKDIRGYGSDTLVLIGNYLSDSTGTFFSEAEIQRLVSQASLNPVFCMTASFIGNGTLGGFVSSTGENSKKISSMAEEIMSGAHPDDIPIILNSASLNHWQFDYKTVNRFNINLKNLPAGYTMINRPLPVWESNPYAFRLLLTIAALFLLIIIGFVFFHMKNKKIMLRITRQKELFETVNNVSSVLLEPEMNHRFEDSLQKAMSMMAEAIHGDRVCIWMKNDEPRLCFTLNYQWENGDFKTLHENGVLAPNIWFDSHPSWNETLLQGKCINSLVRDMLPSDRDELTPRNILSILVVPILLHDQFWGFVGFDICNKERLFTKNEELIMRSASRMIAHAIIRREMTLQMEIAANEANKANKAKSSFLANMSHEIRTPMNAILGIAEIQLRDETLSPEAEEANKKIYESGDLLLNIINDILDLSKIEAGKLELIPVKYDIPSLVNDTVQLNRLRFDSKPIELSINVDENTPHYLLGDELRVKQVMNNILSNAFKYTDEGSVSLSVHPESMDNESVTVVFRICDTGQGMSETQLKNLFYEYTRFNAEANRETVGTGLGMSITKHLLELMNGDISVKSELGKGSEFIVRIPQKRAGPETCGKEISEKLKKFNFRSTTLTNKTQFLREYMPYGSVLVVDDVESNIYVTRGMLLPYGIKVDSASSGFEAINKVEEGNIYDIIFMDHMMPKMDGIETTNRLRKMGYTHTIVALTANALIGREEMFLKNGFDGFISKPIDSRELNLMLNELIRNKKSPEVIEAARQKIAIQKSGINAVNNGLAAAAAADIDNAINVLEELQQGLSKEMSPENLLLYTTTVHGLKSALANIGENTLSKTAFKLEQAGNNGSTEIILSETAEFINALRSLMEKIKLPETGNTQEISRDDLAFLHDKLNEINEACGKLSIKDARTILSGIKEKTWPRKISDILSDISLYLIRGEYAKIAPAVEKMKNLDIKAE